MKYFEVGQVAWDFRYGRGIVSKDDGPDSIHPIHVRFETHQQSYSFDGRHTFMSSYVSLFQTEPIITPNIPIIEFEQGELVLVKKLEEWVLRYYSHLKDGKHYCFSNQKTKGNTTRWWEIKKLNTSPLQPVVLT